MIISFVLEKLESETRLSPKRTFVKMLQCLIVSEKLAGLTIPELLGVFSQQLNSSTKVSAASGSRESADLYSLQVALTEAIGIFPAQMCLIHDLLYRISCISLGIP